MKYLVDCQQGESHFNEKGILVGSSITHEYYNIYCLLIGKGAPIQEIYYPFLFFSTPKQLIDMVKIGLLAEKKGLKYIDPGVIMPDKQKWVILYQSPKYLEDAYLWAYINQLLQSSQIKIKNFLDRLATRWLKNHLTRLPAKAARGIYLNLYYRLGGFTPEMKKTYRKKYPQGTKNMIEESKRKYQFVKEYDNFADFKKKLAEAKKRGLAMEKKWRQDPGFEKFKKKTPVRDFRFPIKEAQKTGLLSGEMMKEIKKFQDRSKKSRVTI